MSITDTLLEAELVTYARVLAGFTATPRGFRPTAMVWTTVLVAPSITETLFEPEFAT